MTGEVITEEELRERFPDISWDEPIPAIHAETAERRFACRYCIGMYGLRGADHDGLWETKAEVLDHISQFHRKTS